MNKHLAGYCVLLIADLTHSMRYVERHQRAILTSPRRAHEELIAASYKSWYAWERARATTLLAVLPQDTEWGYYRLTLATRVAQIDALYFHFWEGR
jgi:hypothetical protein